MEDYDYFNESVPDGISNAIDAYDSSLECSGQDGHELLVKTFLITIETQPASTGVVALEPFDSRS